LSTSGGSTNVLRGFEEANRRGMLTIGLATTAAK
jgi:D-sedoheptulose 7-phosphate isomerase